MSLSIQLIIAYLLFLYLLNSGKDLLRISLCLIGIATSKRNTRSITEINVVVRVPLISALERKNQKELYEFKVRLVATMSSRPSRGTE